MSDEILDGPKISAKKKVFEGIDTDPVALPRQLPVGNHTGKLPDEVVKKWLSDFEEFKRLWVDSEDFSLQVPYLVEMAWDEPFLGSLSRRISKLKSGNIPTAGVRILAGQLELIWNPIFFKHELKKVSDAYPTGVLKHELYHIIFEHITTRRNTPHILWNAATDCAINSLIPRHELPNFCLMPGELYVPPDAAPDWKPSIIARLIKTFPKEKHSEWYMDKFLEDPEVQQAMANAKAAAEAMAAARRAGKGKPDDAQGEGGEGSDEKKPGDGQGDPSDQDGDAQSQRDYNKALEKELYGRDGGQFDDHDMWDSLSDEERDMMRDYIRDMFRDCVKDAERQAGGWGSVPDSVRQHLRKVLSKEIDWRELLNQFIGRSRSTQTTSSIKRVNRRAPWDFPGRKRSYSAKPAIAFDQSGSMHDDWVALFFAELGNLGNVVEYDIIPFDYTVDEKNIQSIRRGGQPNVVRTRQGGTSFDAPVEFINKNPGKYDALILLTDGGCSQPMKCDIPMAYVLAPNCELMFDPKDVPVIRMTDTRKK